MASIEIYSKASCPWLIATVRFWAPDWSTKCNAVYVEKEVAFFTKNYRLPSAKICCCFCSISVPVYLPFQVFIAFKGQKYTQVHPRLAGALYIITSARMCHFDANVTSTFFFGRNFPTTVLKPIWKVQKPRFGTSTIGSLASRTSSTVSDIEDDDDLSSDSDSDYSYSSLSASSRPGSSTSMRGSSRSGSRLSGKAMTKHYTISTTSDDSWRTCDAHEKRWNCCGHLVQAKKSWNCSLSLLSLSLSLSLSLLSLSLSLSLLSLSLFSLSLSLSLSLSFSPPPPLSLSC